MPAPTAPLPVDSDDRFDDLTAAILDAFGEDVTWKPRDGSAPVPARAYVRRTMSKQESFGRVFHAHPKVSALMSAAAVPTILQGDIIALRGTEMEVGEVIPDGSAFVRFPLREIGK